MKTTILFTAAILVMPSILPAQSRNRPARPASRAAFRSAAPVTQKAAAPRVYRTAVSQGAVSATPVTAATLQASRIHTGSSQVAAARGMGSSARSGRSNTWSRGFEPLGFQRRGLFTARRVDAPAESSAQTESPPPYLYTPGALIRTEGLGYSATPTNDARWQTNAPGYAIVQDPNQSTVLNPFPGVHRGPADKLPPPNPWGGGRASGRNAITPNAVVLTDSDTQDHNRDEGGKPDNPKDKDK